MKKIILAEILIIFFMILSITSTLLAEKAKPPPQAVKTVLLLHFDEARGTKAKDSSGHENHGKVVNAKWVKGKSGTALEFNGKNSSVDCRRRTDFNFGKKDDFSIECWIKVAKDTPKQFMYILTNRVRSDRPGFSLMLHKNMQIMVGVADLVNSLHLMGKKPLNDDQWHHLVLTAERKGKIFLYVDGKPVDSEEMNGIVDVTNPDDRPLKIGDRGHKDGFFQGLIDEVKISKGIVPPQPKK